MIVICYTTASTSCGGYLLIVGLIGSNLTFDDVEQHDCKKSVEDCSSGRGSATWGPHYHLLQPVSRRLRSGIQKRDTP